MLRIHPPLGGYLLDKIYNKRANTCCCYCALIMLLLYIYYACAFYLVCMMKLKIYIILLLPIKLENSKSTQKMKFCYSILFVILGHECTQNEPNEKKNEIKI